MDRFALEAGLVGAAVGCRIAFGSREDLVGGLRVPQLRRVVGCYQGRDGGLRGSGKPRLV